MLNKPSGKKPPAAETSSRPSATIIPAAAVIVIAVYAATQLLADIASLKIGVVFGLAVDMGAFIFPITFTLRDLAHKVLGRKNTRVLIIVAALINLAAVGYLLFSAQVPSDEGWGLGGEFAAIFTPMWRIVISSIVAQIVSQLINTEVYHWFVTRITTRFQWARVLVSNTVAIPIDNAIFVIGAFGWAMPWSTIGEIFLVNFAIKYIVMLFSIPLIYATKYDVR